MKCRAKSNYFQQCATEINIVHPAALCMTLILWQRLALCVQESKVKSFVLGSVPSLGINCSPYVEERERI